MRQGILGGKDTGDKGAGDVGEGHVERSGRATYVRNTIKACHF